MPVPRCEKDFQHDGSVGSRFGDDRAFGRRRMLLWSVRRRYGMRQRLRTDPAATDCLSRQRGLRGLRFDLRMVPTCRWPRCVRRSMRFVHDELRPVRRVRAVEFPALPNDFLQRLRRNVLRRVDERSAGLLRSVRCLHWRLHRPSRMLRPWPSRSFLDGTARPSDLRRSVRLRRLQQRWLRQLRKRSRHARRPDHARRPAQRSRRKLGSAARSQAHSRQADSQSPNRSGSASFLQQPDFS